MINIKVLPFEMKKNIFNYTPTQLKQLLQSWKEPAFRSTQIVESLWHSLSIQSFSEITTLSKSLRQKCDTYFSFSELTENAILQKASDGTQKALLTLFDGHTIECVAIPKDKRLTFCLSTQVGCSMACSFCATAALGFKRNLKAAEMVEQIRFLMHLTGQKPTNLVFMGMGEPLQNIDELRTMFSILTHPKALHWPAKRSTISTCGWLPGLETLLKDPLPARLALSLNAVSNALRDKLMPVNKQFPIEKVLQILRLYSQKYNESITFEYILIGGTNDHEEDAQILIKLLKNINAKVNIIPYNPVQHLTYRAPNMTATETFLATLKRGNIVATLRHSRGQAIHAACGQLAGQDHRRNHSS